jgi:UDP-arabinose 4-epimerase
MAVMHFAAFAYVGESVIDPGKYYRNNVAGTLTSLEAVRDHQISHFVFSSTCATYGEPTAVPIPETYPQAPINPYGASKLMIERMLADFEHAHGLRSVSLRYSNAAGADPDGEIGECHDPETHLIPLVLDVAAALRSDIKVFGENYSTPDGTCIRDYIHVTDLANAHVSSLNYLIRGGASVQMNLGTGMGHSVKEVITTAERVTGCKILVTSGARRPGDPPKLVAEATTAKKLLGWAPANSGLEEIIGSAWAWHQSGKLKR